MTKVLQIALLMSFCMVIALSDSNIQSSLLDLDKPSGLEKRAKCHNIRNSNSCDYWSRIGFCRSRRWMKWMRKNCAKSCGVCGTTTARPTKRPPTQTPKKKCNPNKRDPNECRYYKSRGYCSRTHKYHSSMKKICPITCRFCDMAGKPRVQIVPVVQEECLKAHNDKREIHGAPLLDWDMGLARQAQKWALKIAEQKTMKHSPSSERKNQGENLAMSWSYDGARYTCKQATQDWYNEVKDYNYAKPGFSMKTGHFTQVVWRSSKHLGVGIARNGNIFYVVARYSPPGNAGRYRENVRRGR